MLTKDSQIRVLMWVKLHDVLLATFTADGLSVIASRIGMPLMLDSYTCTMCTESWGMSSYARAMIKIEAKVEFKDSVVVVVLNIDDEGYTCAKITVECKWKPLLCLTCKTFDHSTEACPQAVKVVPNKHVETQDDSFQVVKGKKEGTSGYQWDDANGPNLVSKGSGGMQVESDDRRIGTSGYQWDDANGPNLVSKGSGGMQVESDDEDVENIYDDTYSMGASTPSNDVSSV
ncbi:hypothetical protein Tco_1102817 [Tanacetum coccineum]